MDLSSLSDEQVLSAAGIGAPGLNNAGNIRDSSGNFASYPTPQAGVDAMRQDLLTKVSGNSKAMKANFGEGYNPTLSNVISTWAPSTENNTKAYIDFVAGKSGLDPNQPLAPEDVDKIMPHMITMEHGAKGAKQYSDSGQVATDAKIDNGADLSKLSDQELLQVIGQQTDKKQNIGKIESSISGAADTTAFGLGDEIMGGLMAPVEYAGGRALAALGAKFQPDKDLSKMSLSDIYDMEKKSYNDRNIEAQKENPLSYLSGQLAGGLTTGAVGASTKTGQAIGNIARSGLLPDATSAIGKLANLATKATAGAGIGAASSALYGLGSGEDGNRLQNAEQSGIYGAVAGGAAPAIGSALASIGGTIGNTVRGLAARSPEALQDIASTAKGSASKIYDQMRSIGAEFKPSAAQGFLLPDIDKSLSKLNFIPGLSPKTNAIVDDLKTKISNGNLGLDQLDQYRRQLGRIWDGEDAVAAGAVRHSIDDFVNSANKSHLVNGSKDAIDLLNQGRQAYAQASKFEKVADIVQKAAGDPNKIRSGINRFVNNDKNIRGFSDSEISNLKSIAKGDLSDSALKGLSAFGFDAKHILGPAIGSGLASTALGGPAGLALAGAGTVARQVRNMATRGEVENLMRVLEGKSSGKSSLRSLSKLTAPSSSAKISASNLTNKP